MLNRTILGRGVVLCDPYHGSGQYQSNQSGQVQVHRRNILAINDDTITQHRGRDGVVDDRCQYPCNGQSTVECIHDLATLTGLNKVTSDDGCNDRKTA